MLKLISEVCTEKMITNGVIEDNRKETYIYGFQLFFSTISSIMSIVIISLITGNLEYGLIYLGVFILLRTTANGYHASSFAKCFTMTNMLFIVYLIIVDLTPIKNVNFHINLILLILCYIYIWCNSPIEHPNHRLSKKKKKQNKFAAIVIGGVLIFMVQIACSLAFYDIAFAVSVALYIVVLMMTMKNKIMKPLEQGNKRNRKNFILRLVAITIKRYAIMGAGLASWGTIYQPEVPEELK